MYDMYDPIIHI